MYEMKLEKITPTNGFDEENKDNAKQNNYAWSIAEMGNYIYVGTGRNIPYIGAMAMDLPAPKEISPTELRMIAEIWRYPKCGVHRKWERVFETSASDRNLGFRSMITYRDETCTTAIYTSCFGLDQTSHMYMSVDGITWDEIPGGIPEGYNSRSLCIHNNRLYTGASTSSGTDSSSYLYSTQNPRKGWFHVPTEGIQGEIVAMVSFNGYLYVGASTIGGFTIWKSKKPELGEWTCVVDKGAGDALNEVPISMEAFKGHVYVGTGIWLGVQSVDPDKVYVPPKGFDIIRIHKNDDWELVVGGEPIQKTTPTTGVRNKSKYESGFGNMLNSYCWQLRSYKGKLYVTSWDAGILYRSILLEVIRSTLNLEEDEDISNMEFGTLLSYFNDNELFNEYDLSHLFKNAIELMRKYPMEYGFDLLVSKDGKNFSKLSVNGLNNPKNYGLRTLFVSSNDKMYMGTANPYEGCEVWEFSEKNRFFF